MISLSICIPTFNRLECLDNCLNSILISSKYSKDFKFEVCVSDNHSEKNPETIIKKYHDLMKIKFNRNSTNLGFALNAIKTVQMAEGKYAWLIGDDDLILPNTFEELNLVFENNKSVDYFFVNSFHLDSNFLDKYSKPFNTLNLNLNGMKKLSKAKYNKKVKFWEIIDPKVSWEFLIGIFLSIFERKKWLEGLKYISEEDINDKRVWSNFDNTCLNAKIISSVFKNSDCYICAKPLTVNLVGKREWIGMYDFIEIVRIPELLDYYRSQGLSLIKYIYCKNFALRNFFNFFFKILINGEKAGRSYVKLNKHFIKNFIFPNSWLSIFFYLFRKTNKILKIYK